MKFKQPQRHRCGRGRQGADFAVDAAQRAADRGVFSGCRFGRFGQKCRALVDLASRSAAARGKLGGAEKIAAEGNLATKTLRIQRGDVPDKLAQFVNEVTAAGYILAAGRPTVVHIGEPDRQKGEVSVELQVPIAKK